MDDQNKGPALVTVVVVTSAIAIVLTILRIYVRAKIVRKLEWDDLLIVLGMVRPKSYRSKVRPADDKDV